MTALSGIQLMKNSTFMQDFLKDLMYLVFSLQDSAKRIMSVSYIKFSMQVFLKGF